MKRARAAADRVGDRETLPREAIFLAQTPQAFRATCCATRSRWRGATRPTKRRSPSGPATPCARRGRGREHEDHDAGRSRDGATAIATAPAASRRRRASAPATTCIGSSTGRPLILGGVTIPFDRGLLGHSDADAVCHAVTDAMLGAAGARRHRPALSRTPIRAWKGAIEHRAAAARGGDRARDAGFAVVQRRRRRSSLERPKLAPHVDAMRASLAAALGIDADRVSVKGKTNEGVDAIGRGEAIAVHAVALLSNRDLSLKRRSPDASPLRTEPDRSAARRQRAHGAVQLAARARHRTARSSCASRTPTSSARRASPRRRSSTTCAGSGSTGTKGPTSAARTARTGSPSGCISIASYADGAARAAGTRTTASARRSSSRPIGRRRSPPGGRRSTPARCRALSREQARGADRRPASGRRSASACPSDREVVVRRRRARRGARSTPTSSAIRCSCAPTARPPTTSPSSSTMR